MVRLRHCFCIAVLAALLGGCTCGGGAGQVYWSLSPDGGKLAFDWCWSDGKPCTVAVYQFEDGDLSLYRNTTGKNWRNPSFSPDGGQLAFSVVAPDGETAQIATLNADGTGFREVTSGWGYRAVPAFSPDGRKLTYMRAGSWSKRYWTPYRGNVKRPREMEICVLDTRLLREKRITHLDPYSFSSPHFLPGGEHVLFNYVGFDRKPDTDRLTGENVVQAVDGGPAIQVLTRIRQARDPTVSADGRRIVFQADTTKMDGKPGCCDYDLFLWEGMGGILDSRGTIRRLTHAGSYLSGFALSADGSKLAYAFDRERNGKMEFFIMDLNGGEIRRFAIPETPSGWIGPAPAS